jgi:hypothetical protein
MLCIPSVRRPATAPLFAIVSLLAACAASEGARFGEDAGPGGPTSAGTGGAPGTGGGLDLPTGPGGGMGQGYGCSPDLRYVVDELGNIVEECWPDAGCAGGMCVAPCDAAAASKGNVGCEFVVPTPHFYVGIKSPCFAVFLANNWPKPVKITIARGGSTFDASQFGRIPDTQSSVQSWPAVPAGGVPAGQVAVLFLSHDPTSVNGTPLVCPVPPAVNGPNGAAVVGSGVGQAWRITTDIPVSAYDILPYGGALSYLPSAELLLPTSAWGTNYIAVLPKDSAGPPWGQLAATSDGTKIKVLPSSLLPQAGPVPAGTPNVPVEFTLNAGDFVQWQLQTEMTGSVIQSDKPVAFTGGNGYICYSSATSTGGGCDSAHQMIPPIAAQGHEYVAMPYADRGNAPESIPYRLVGAVDGTTLSYDPPIASAPTSLTAGQKVDLEVVGSFRVKSQDKDHPFYLGQIMSGCQVQGANLATCLGDEEYVNQLPPAQFLSKYVFFTDPTYPTTNLVLARVATASGFKDVKVDCLGTVGAWQPVGTEGKYEITKVDLIRLGTPNMGCTNGPHSAESEGPFGLMVWGLDTYSSYGYPAGGSVAPINTVVVPPVPK